MAPPPLLSLRDAAIGFGGPPLFAGLTLHIAKGDIACLVGRNGCGKSTLMKLIAGELELDAGERYAEPGLTVAYLAQEPAVKAGTRVFDWVSADVALGRPQATHPRHAVDAALSLFELDGGRDVASLSGGEQRRAALAQVFVDPPGLLLLDEPTNHLDMGIIYIPRHQAVSGSSSAGASGRSAALKIASRISSAVAGSGSITYFGGRPRPRFGVAASTLSECATAAASRPCRERPRPSASGCRDRGHCGARRIRSRNAGGASGSSGDRCPDIRA